MSISTLSFLPLISAVFVLSLGIFVFLKNKKSKLNIIFFLLSISFIVWFFSTFMMFISQTDKQAVFWDRTVYLGVIFIPILMYHFSLVFSKAKNNKKLYLGYLLTFIFVILSRTDYFVAGLFKYEWGVHTKAMLLHHFFLIYFSTYLFFFYYNIYKHYRKTKIGIERNQAKYIFIAFLVLLSGSLAYLPAYGVGIYPFAYLSGMVFVVILAYAILKYRLMDIRIVAKKSTVFTTLVMIITAAYVLAAFLLSWVIFGGIYTFKSQIITGLIVAILVALGFRPFYNWLKKITDTFLFKGEYRPAELVADISDILSRTLSLRKIIEILKEKISNSLRLEKVEILVLGEKNIKLKIGKESLQKIIDYFKKEREILILEELKRKKAEKISFVGTIPPIKQLEKNKIGLVAPLFIKNKLVGIFLLGPKKSGDMFTPEDIQTLEIISSQAGISIENARLYQKQKNFSQTLQREVDRQTKKLREAYEELKKLDKAKTEFISMASHQLRTPVSIMKGIASMLIEGDLEKLPEQKKNNLIQGLWRKSCKLEEVIDDILNATEMTSTTYRVQQEKAEKINVEEIIRKIIDDFQSIIKEKNIDLVLKKPSMAIPRIYGQKDYLQEALSNLIDNAIKYTPSLQQRKDMENIKIKKGKIEVSLAGKEDKIIVSIKDNGIGIPQKELPKLFQRFSRANNARDMYTDGSGLGLFIVKEIVEGHNGKAWVESKLGEGATFFVSLPLNLFKVIDVKKHIIEK